MKTKLFPQVLTHFARSAFEGRLWELGVAFVSGILSYKGFTAKLAIIAFPMAGVCLISLVSLITAVICQLKENRTNNDS